MQGARVMTTQSSTPWTGIQRQDTAGCAAHNRRMERVFLQDRATAAAWHQEDRGNISTFDLPDAVELAAAFFRPLPAQVRGWYLPRLPVAPCADAAACQCRSA